TVHECVDLPEYFEYRHDVPLRLASRLMDPAFFPFGNAGSGSAHPIPVHRHAPHVAALAVIVVEREVPDAAIVPEGEGAGRPAKAAGEGFAAADLEKVVQQRTRLLLRPAGEAQRE